jgi:hypothetical protein
LTTAPFAEQARGAGADHNPQRSRLVASTATSHAASSTSLPETGCYQGNLRHSRLWRRRHRGEIIDEAALLDH